MACRRGIYRAGLTAVSGSGLRADDAVFAVGPVDDSVGAKFVAQFGRFARFGLALVFYHMIVRTAALTHGIVILLVIVDSYVRLIFHRATHIVGGGVVV